ncbi:MAG: tetratricopeptide repeat protein [Gemmatimonadetes bacterium]|nr:tetratricopeptide repeat protein [Gemmatimonadota bacterium]
MRSLRRLVLWAGLAMITGCGARQLETVSPESIPDLEAKVAAQGDNPVTLLALGEAYYAAQRYAEARTSLEKASALDPTNDRARLYTAFTLEALDQYAEARAAYQDLRARKPDRSVGDAINERLLLLDRKQAVAAAREAVEREAFASTEPLGAYTVAVLPLQYVGADSALKPLERGLAELMVTDLGTVSRLTLVERLHVQALLDEIKLSETGRVDPAGAARSGRLLRASRVIEGTIGDRESGELSVEAAVIDANTAGIAGTASGQDKLQALFDLEKQIVFSIIEQLGVQLTPGERDKIAERPTKNIQAFLAYSRGLEAQAGGNFEAAMGAFRQALNLDPSFAAARQAATVSAQLIRGAGLEPAALAPRLSRSVRDEAAHQRLRETVARITPAGGDRTGGGHNDRDDASERKAVQEGTDTQGPTDATRNTTITITVSRPASP